MKDQGTLWAFRDPGNARFERFGDEALLLDPVSWETHSLREPAASVAEALLEGPASGAELADRCIDAEIPRDEANALIEEALSALLALGVAFPERECP